MGSIFLSQLSGSPEDPPPDPERPPSLRAVGEGPPSLGPPSLGGSSREGAPEGAPRDIVDSGPSIPIKEILSVLYSGV